MRRRRKLINEFLQRASKRLPYFLLFGLWTGVLLVLLLGVDPSVVADILIPGAYLPFVMIFGLATFFGVYAMTRNVVLSVLPVFVIGVSLQLYLIDLLTFINVILLVLMGGVFYYALREKREVPNN